MFIFLIIIKQSKIIINKAFIFELKLNENLTTKRNVNLDKNMNFINYRIVVKVAFIKIYDLNNDNVIMNISKYI